MVYNDIMTPIEMLNNHNRLPVTLDSSVYEPNLEASMTLNSSSAPEYQQEVEENMKLKMSHYWSSDDILDSQIPQIEELVSDPISACQFYTIEVFFIL